MVSFRVWVHIGTHARADTHDKSTPAYTHTHVYSADTRRKAYVDAQLRTTHNGLSYLWIPPATLFHVIGGQRDTSPVEGGSLWRPAGGLATCAEGHLL